LRKKLLKCYIWSMALYGAETWTLRAADQKHLESFEVWCWRRAGLRTVLSSHLSHSELRSSLREFHTHSVQFFMQFFTQLNCTV
jgi:hypothetical protein